jgi:1,4-alpha-glucan branching enzyme
VCDVFLDFLRKEWAMLSTGEPKKKDRKRKVTFSLDAPKAKEVILIGDFNNWDPQIHPMEKEQGGVWKKTVMLSPARYEYRFLVDGQWYHDPENPDFCFNSFGSCNNVLFISGA